MTRRRSGPLTVLGALLCASLCSQSADAAQSMTRAAGYRIEEVSRSWHAITSLAETSDGHLWIGTISGVIRWDGVRHTPIGWSDGARSVQALAAGGKGALWVATGAPPALSRFNPVTRRMEETSLWREGKPIVALTATSDSVWAASEAAVFRSSSDRLEKLSSVHGTVRGMVVGLDETVYVLTSLGLWRSSIGGEGAMSPVSIDGIAGTTSSISVTPRGVLMIGTLAGEVWSLDGSTPGKPSLVTTGLGAPVRDVVVLDPSTYFFATRNAGYIEHSGERTSLGTFMGIAAVLLDHLGHVWIGGRPALHHLYRPLVTNFRTPNMAIAFSVAQTIDGHVWATMGSELIEVSESDMVRIRGPGPAPWPSCLRGLAGDAVGGIWVAACRDGLMRIDGEQVEMFPLPGALQALPVRLMLVLVTRGGAVWATTDRGHVLRLTATGLVVVHTGSGGCTAGSVDDLCPSKVTAMAEGSDGTIILATIGDGVLRIKGTTVTPWLDAESIGTNKILSLLVGSGADLWIGTRDAGLVLWRNGRIIRGRGDQSMPIPSVNSLVDDGNGQLWIGSTDGVHRLGLRDLASRLERGYPVPRGVLYNRADGLDNERCSDGFSPGALRDRLGRVWFATHGGLAKFSAPNSWIANPLVGVNVETVSIDGVESIAPNVVRIPFRARRVQLDFIAPISWQSHRISYRYRLQGFDPEWNEAGSNRQATYTNLPVGTYAFVVDAQLDDFSSSRVEYTLPIVVEPLLGRTIVFLGTLVALFFVAFAIQRWRSVLARRRFQALLDERNRIARDVHDTVAQGFVAIGLQLDRVSRRMQKDPSAAAELLSATRSIVDQCRTETRQAVWNLRTNGLHSTDLRTSLEAVSSQASLAANVSIAFDTQGGTRPVADATHDALCAMVGEALTNAVAHGRADRIQVKLTYGEQALVVSVFDNGTGFDTDASKQREGAHLHLGFVGLKERAASVGGSVKVVSAPTRGTEVVMTVPLQKPSLWQIISSRGKTE